MNGLQITGMKLSSPAPIKKTVLPPQKTAQKPKPLTKPPVKKASANAPAQKKSSVPIQKKAEKKIEQKGKKVQEPKPEPVKQEQKIEQVVSEPPIQPTKEQEQIPDYEVTLRYNHYKDKFPCQKGILSFKAPNQKYCFGLVFLGNYQPIVRHFKTRELVQPLTTGTADEFSWKVQEGEVYEVQIQEDEQQQSKREKHVYKAPEPEKKCPCKKNAQVAYLTEEMKKLGVDELGSQRHKQLLQQRDLEDILYS